MFRYKDTKLLELKKNVSKYYKLSMNLVINT